MKTQIKNLFTCLGRALRAAWVLPALIASLGLMPVGTVQAQMTTAFMYHGILDDNNGIPANGSYDFQFAIWNQNSPGGTLITTTPFEADATGVTNGLFTVQLDFGSTPFSDNSRWLEIAVRPHGPGTFNTLSPRQQFTATPYAIRAANFGGTVIASQLAAGAAAANLGSSGQSGVASGGLVLSTNGNAALTTAGYVKIGGTMTTGDIWTNVSTAPLVARSGYTAVWTGSKMIVWGGQGNVAPFYFNDGAIYDPVANSWTPMTTVGAPAGRFSHTAVWTGSKMIIWGGMTNFNTYVNDGGIYDPAANSWTAIPNTLANTPSARARQAAVWTGSTMIIWGGWSGSYPPFTDGGIYDPAANNWTSIPNTLANTPAARIGNTTVWTNGEMIVWGGFRPGITPTLYFNDGGRYNPAANSWTAMNTSGAPSGRSGHTAVLTDSEMIIWGGGNDSGNFNTGGRYNLAGDSWTTMSTSGAPGARTGHGAVWTGSEMIVWGGNVNGSYSNDGGRYNPAMGGWTAAVSTFGAPAAASSVTAVWTGSEMIVCAGDPNVSFLGYGCYTPGNTLYLYQRP